MAEVRLKFTADTASADSGINKIKNSLQSLKTIGAGFGSVLATSLAAAGAGITALGAAAVKGTKDIIDLSGEIKDIADATDMSVSSIVLLREQFRQAGVDTGKLQMSLTALSNKLSDPDKTTTGWLEKWKISLQEIQAMGVEERFELIRGKIAGMATQAERLKASKDFFGKSGADLSRMFGDKDAQKNAATMLGGLPATLQSIASTLESAGDKFDGVTIKWQQFFAGFSAQLLGPIEAAAGIVEKLDLTSVGIKAGMVVQNLIEEFKQGNLVVVLADIILSGFLKVANELTILLTFIVGKAVADGFEYAMKNSAPGKGASTLAGAAGMDNTLYVPGNKPKHDLSWAGPLGGLYTLATMGKANPEYYRSELRYKDFREAVLESPAGAANDEKHFQDLFNRLTTGVQKRHMAVGLNADEIAALKQSAIDDAAKWRAQHPPIVIPDFTKDFMEAARNSEVASQWAENFLGNPLNYQQDKKKETLEQRLDPVVSSLGKVGGARGETGSSVVRFQNMSLRYQKEISDNTRKMTGGAIIG